MSEAIHKPIEIQHSILQLENRQPNSPESLKARECAQHPES